MATNDIEREVNDSKNLIRKLRTAYEKRSTQAHMVQAHIGRSPYPVIVCGDFNDTPTSYTYNTISRGLNDTFKVKGNGLGATYNGKMPFLRIDYIFTDPSIHILKHEVMRTNISDHFPVCASIEMRK
jgi:endonuclease/exonuclease/phosphatase family metal-dependent hydrolase